MSQFEKVADVVMNWRTPLALALVFAFLAAACPAGPPEPDDCEERLAYAIRWSFWAGKRAMIDSLYKARVLTGPEFIQWATPFVEEGVVARRQSPGG